ncbi:MAG: hypothetical protein LBV70_03810 [Candidatus Adiutrix sp.]|nr:hypothetical protein [Candidatus Adiutrix sp.]
MNQAPKIEAVLNPGTDRRSGVERRSATERRSGLARRRAQRREAEVLLARDLPNMPDKASLQQEAMLINEITLVLAEKRTALSVMRTGLAVLALPLSVLSVLIVISRYYDPAKVIYLLGPLLVICAGLIVFGVYLIGSSLRRIRALNRVSAVLKRQNDNLRELSRFLNEKTGRPVVQDREA